MCVTCLSLCVFLRVVIDLPVFVMRVFLFTVPPVLTYSHCFLLLFVHSSGLLTCSASYTKRMQWKRGGIRANKRKNRIADLVWKRMKLERGKRVVLAGNHYMVFCG